MYKYSRMDLTSQILDNTYHAPVRPTQQNLGEKNVADKRGNKIILELKEYNICLPALWAGLIPIPSLVMIALVAGGTLNWKIT